MIKVFGAARLTADPEITQANNGNQFTTIRLAMNTGDMDPNTHRPIPIFCDATVWGKQGEACATYLHKGDSVTVLGDFTVNEWKGRDGQNRTNYRIKNANVEFGARTKNSPAPAADDDDMLPED